ncbi:MobC family plasmid mobilization relaxosome protein [Streptomyces sp. AVP053U2]|uniref:MobC family plasmid mobilization relaxosome protein n=1 Tax=Streptomyces sp. AVP053U2 TaxID=1737066 RepID=UPI00073B30F9|nr:MobC family plasmid mobilization relaxosome protein [Streptomyces sp. AVP053U2]ODA69464.1 Bacterial mobilization protein (MobC) [Streptomyces sp. AVP053U2]
MRDLYAELPIPQEQMVTTPVTRAASNSDGPSIGRSIANTSAPGVAEEQLRHEGVPEQEWVSAGEQPTGLVTGAKQRTPHRRANLDAQRSEHVTARFAPHEKHDIQSAAKAEHVTMARYIADATMARVRGEITVAAPRTVYDDAVDELATQRAQIARIGNNVNQIARRLNSGGDPHPVDASILQRAERLLATAQDTVRAIDDAAFRAAGQKAGGLR